MKAYFSVNVPKDLTGCGYSYKNLTTFASKANLLYRQNAMNFLRNTLVTTVLLAGTALISCGNSSKKDSGSSEETTKNETIITAPAFSSDSAYQYIAEQVAFGPRVPNTPAHKACGDYLAKQLERFGAKVYNQSADLIAYDGTILKARNIVGVYNPENKKRVLLCAHWDSRPYADQDKEENHHRPIDGANDGASGVGVLLEIARQIQMQAPAIGIDIAFFDAEDYGIPEFYEGNYKQDTWCLGSQYWGRIPHVTDYKARFGILLDMVDHVYVNQLRQFPCVDIIHYDNEGNTGFNPTWHTLNDNLEHIDKSTLQAVGQTVMGVIYNEK